MTIDQFLNELYIDNTEISGLVYDIIVTTLGRGDVIETKNALTTYLTGLLSLLTEEHEAYYEIEHVLALMLETDWV